MDFIADSLVIGLTEHAPLVLAAMGGSGPARLWSCLALACLAAGEVLGRWRFYGVYGPVGL